MQVAILARKPASILNKVRHWILPIDLPPFVFQLQEAIHGHGHGELRIREGEQLTPVWVIPSLFHLIYLHRIGIGLVSIQGTDVESKGRRDPIIKLRSGLG